MTNEQADQLVDQAVRQLSEQFDVVQILVSWPDQDGTKNIYQGSGNWFARQGMVQDFQEVSKSKLARPYD